jgi:hypothetical protein
VRFIDEHKARFGGVETPDPNSVPSFVVVACQVAAAAGPVNAFGSS